MQLGGLGEITTEGLNRKMVVMIMCEQLCVLWSTVTIYIYCKNHRNKNLTREQYMCESTVIRVIED